MKLFTYKKGFTLIELIVVIAILGVLALILVPQFMGYVDDADIQTQRTNTKAVYDSAMASCAKLRTLPKADRNMKSLSKFIDDGLGESYKNRYKVKIAVPTSNPNVTNVYTISKPSTDTSTDVKNPTVRSVQFDDCTYDAKTNTYSGTCADASGS